MDGAELQKGGDIVVAIDDKPVRRFEDLVDALAPTTDQRTAFDALLQGSAGDAVTVAPLQAYLDATAGNL